MAHPKANDPVALALKAAIGDIGRFESPQKLVSYLGLNPSVRQSGPGPAYHGRITRQGRGHARGMLVEAAWAAARAAWSLAGVFPSGAGPAWAARGGGGNGSQACCPDLAFAAQGRELPLGSPCPARQKGARSRTQGRARAQPGPEESRPRLQPAQPSRTGTALGRTGRDGLCALRGGLERQ